MQPGVPRQDQGQTTTNTEVSNLSDRFLQQMTKLDEMNNQAIEAGNNRLGWWIGPSTVTDVNPFMPVFILAQPLELKTSDKIQGDIGGNGEVFELRHKYVLLTTDGPIALTFRKRLIDALGERSVDHTGPGGEKSSDYDDIEGGERNLLAVLDTGRREHNNTGFGGDIGLVYNTEGKLSLVLGHPNLEHVNYSEVEDHKMNWWWIEPTVNDEELKQALAQSIDKSKTKLPDDEGAINEARKNRQSSIIDDLIG